jgi:putative phosphoesterase
MGLPPAMINVLLMSDIHANYPALGAVEEFVRTRRIHRVVHAGDVTVYGTFPNETIRWFREREHAVCIVGNTDRRVLGILAGEGLRKPGKEEKRVMYFWTCSHLRPENVDFLKSLPEQAELAVGNVRINVIHGDFDDMEEFSLTAAPGRRLRKLAMDPRYRIHVLGHTHAPFHRIIDGIHFINPGSVGRPFDGDPRASFAILTVSSREIAVEHFRIRYPVEQVVADLSRNGLPGIYAEMYRTGRKLN